MARTPGSFSQKTAPRVARAALRLFAKYGYASVSMRQIALDVGVQVGTLYNYTPDKQALLFNILLHHMESLLAAWAHYPKRTDPSDQISDFIQFHLEFHFSKADEVFFKLKTLLLLDFIIQIFNGDGTGLSVLAIDTRILSQNSKVTETNLSNCRFRRGRAHRRGKAFTALS